MNPNRKKRGSPKQDAGKKTGSDYRLIIVLCGAIILSLIMIGILLITSR
jgi:hypothetical protein